MASEPPVTSGGNTMIDRIKAILMAPKDEFPRIAAEPMTVQGIMTGWVAPLAAIGPVASTVGMLIFGISFFGFHWTPSPAYLIASGVTSYVVTLICVYLLALVVDGLAPSFGGQKDQVQALKAVAFSWTAGWIAAVFAIIPVLGILGLVGALYSLYLLFVALPIFTKAPADKAVGYAVVVVIVAIVLFAVTHWTVGAVTAMFAPPPSLGTLDLR